jgi:IS30 family transposase
MAARPVGKLEFNGVAWATLRTLLDWKWSPQQIAATLKRVFPDEPERHVSHETIYIAICAQARGDLRKQLVGLPVTRPQHPSAALPGPGSAWSASTCALRRRTTA